LQSDRYAFQSFGNMFTHALVEIELHIWLPMLRKSLWHKLWPTQTQPHFGSYKLGTGILAPRNSNQGRTNITCDSQCGFGLPPPRAVFTRGLEVAFNNLSPGRESLLLIHRFFGTLVWINNFVWIYTLGSWILKSAVNLERVVAVAYLTGKIRSQEAKRRFYKTKSWAGKIWTEACYRTQANPKGREGIILPDWKN
jgi:hypothetical protein